MRPNNGSTTDAAFAKWFVSAVFTLLGVVTVKQVAIWVSDQPFFVRLQRLLTRPLVSVAGPAGMILTVILLVPIFYAIATGSGA